MNKTNRNIYIALILIICLALAGLNAYSINTHQLKVRQEYLKNPKINEDLDGKLIAYFTDLKYGSLVDDNILDKIKNKINDFKPDIIIFGGDLISSEINKEDEERLIDFLKDIDCEYGKYAIIGDKDNDEVINYYHLGDFNILDNISERIYIDSKNYFNLVGLNTRNIDITKAYEDVNLNNFTLCISHYPDNFNKLPYERTDYVLSGHSLGGQVYLPLINLFNRQEGNKNHIKGKHIKNNTTLDISNGIGFENKKVRFLADSEIVFYKLTYQP